MKANFIQRALAYLLDIFILSFIFSIITIGFKPNTDIEKKYNEVYDNYIKGEITAEQYLDEYTDVLYDMQKANALPNAINTVLIIAYFIVFQYLNKGQTIGKKLLKIKIVNEDKKDISLKQMLIRGIMIYSILSSLINIILFFNVSRKVYMTSYLTIGAIETLILFLSAIFILYRNDKKALHDIVSKSIVIKEK